MFRTHWRPFLHETKEGRPFLGRAGFFRLAWDLRGEPDLLGDALGSEVRSAEPAPVALAPRGDRRVAFVLGRVDYQRKDAGQTGAGTEAVLLGFEPAGAALLRFATAEARSLVLAELDGDPHPELVAGWKQQGERGILVLGAAKSQGVAGRRGRSFPAAWKRPIGDPAPEEEHVEALEALEQFLSGADASGQWFVRLRTMEAILDAANSEEGPRALRRAAFARECARSPIADPGAVIERLKSAFPASMELAGGEDAFPEAMALLRLGSAVPPPETPPRERAWPGLPWSDLRRLASFGAPGVVPAHEFRLDEEDDLARAFGATSGVGWRWERDGEAPWGRTFREPPDARGGHLVLEVLQGARSEESTAAVVLRSPTVRWDGVRPARVRLDFLLRELPMEAGIAVGFREALPAQPGSIDWKPRVLGIEIEHVRNPLVGSGDLLRIAMDNTGKDPRPHCVLLGYGQNRAAIQGEWLELDLALIPQAGQGFVRVRPIARGSDAAPGFEGRILFDEEVFRSSEAVRGVYELSILLRFKGDPKVREPAIALLDNLRAD